MAELAAGLMRGPPRLTLTDREESWIRQTILFRGMHGRIEPGRGYPSSSSWMASFVRRCTRQQHGSIRRLPLRGIAAAAMLGSFALPAVAQPLVGILPSRPFGQPNCDALSSLAWPPSAPPQGKSGNRVERLRDRRQGIHRDREVADIGPAGPSHLRQRADPHTPRRTARAASGRPQRPISLLKSGPSAGRPLRECH